MNLSENSSSDTKQPSDSARAVFNEASQSPRSGTLLIPILFGVIIVGSAYLFPENYVLGISMHWTDLISGLTAVFTFALWRVKQRIKSEKEFRGLKLWVSAGVVSNVMPQFVVLIVAQEVSKDFVQTGFVGFVTYPLLMTLIGLLTSSWLNFKDQVRELAQQKGQLVSMRESLDEEVAATNSELRKLVENRLAEVFQKANLDFADLEISGAQRAASSLRDAIDHVIRPLSRQLAFEAEGVNTAANSFADRERFNEGLLEERVPRDRGNKISLGEIFLPELYVSIAAIFALPAMSYVEGTTGLIKSAITLIAVYVLLRLFGKLAGHLRAHPAAVILLGTVSAFGIAFLSGLINWNFDQSSVGPVAVATCISLCTFGGLAILYLAIRRMRNISERRETNEAISLLVSRLRQEVWVNRRNLARIVHGRVQSKLLAAALRLNKQENPTEDEIGLARADVVAAISAIADELDREEESFKIQFSRIQEAWDGVCEVSLNCDEQLISVIDGDPNARTCLSEVVGEAVANAAKHSGASQVGVNLSSKGNGYLSISISTTGELANSKTAGESYGSHLLDEITAQWNRTGENGVITLTALIAFAPISK